MVKILIQSHHEVCNLLRSLILFADALKEKSNIRLNFENYTEGIPQRLDTVVHSDVTAKTSTACDSSGSDSDEITMCTLV